jgi:hypothetical protein
MTARVLAQYFATVTVIERDHIDPNPALHKSIPQGSHPMQYCSADNKRWQLSIRDFSRGWTS